MLEDTSLLEQSPNFSNMAQSQGKSGKRLKKVKPGGIPMGQQLQDQELQQQLQQIQQYLQPTQNTVQSNQQNPNLQNLQQLHQQHNVSKI